MSCSVKQIVGEKPMNNKKSIKSGDDRQLNTFVKKECEALKEQFLELQVLDALRKNLKKS